MKEKKPESILDETLQLKSEADRKAYIEEVCASDRDLQQKVEDMLEAHHRAAKFFDGATSMLDSLKVEKEIAEITEIDLPERSGTVIDRYKLLEKIGEGGMGVVYMAEQTQPVVRKVALKIIKLGMDTKQVIARFEAERQALAMMDHPNIARVLDGGATETGRPYFVMELVRGIPITEYCDNNKLSTKDRLKLFIPVCQAIQSAHQKGIIHRDIKPSNVLVSLLHGEPIVKVIDFGIAKATNQKLTEKTLFTNFAMMIGTPAYMSPEQAEMSVIDIDTRTDVYSLGVLLYELLTGTTPISEKRLRSEAYRRIQQIIAEEEPEKPSTRMSTMLDQQKTTLAKSRGTNVSKLQQLFKGDLDWITMKCLEKDRRHRYETPSELVSDLHRHLNNEPVSAAAPSLSYQLQKYHRKHKVLFRSAAIISVVLVVATVLSVSLAVRMNQLRKKADVATNAEAKQRVVAETERDRALTVERELQETSIELENNLYVADMLAVEDAVESEELIRVKQLLMRHRKERSGNDLRGLEWRYYWQQARGEIHSSYQAHNGPILKIRMLRDGKRLITVGLDQKVKLWNSTDQRLIQEWDSMKDFEISPNEQYLCVMAGEPGYIGTEYTIWDLQKNRMIRNGDHRGRGFGHFEFTHDSQNLFLNTIDLERQSKWLSFQATVENVLSGEPVFSPEGYLTDFAVSPTEPLVFIPTMTKVFNDVTDPRTAENPPQGYLWNYERKELIHPTVPSYLWGAVFSPSGALIAMTDATPPFNHNESFDLNIFRASTGEKVSTLRNAYIGLRRSSIPGSMVAFSSDEKYLAAPMREESRQLGVWEIATGERVALHAGHLGSIRGIAFHPQSDETLISVSRDKTMQFWDWKEDRTIKRFTGHVSVISTLAVSEGGDRVVTGGQDGSLIFWPGEITTPAAPLPNGSPLAFSPQENYIVLSERTAASPPLRRVMLPLESVSQHLKRSVFSTKNSERLWEIPPNEILLGFSPEERFLLTASTNQFVTRAVKTGLPVRSVRHDISFSDSDFNWHRSKLRSLSPDKKTLATIEDSKRIRLISLETGTTLANFDEPWRDTEATIGSVVFTPSGQEILFTTRAGTGSGIQNIESGGIIWLTPPKLKTRDLEWTCSELIASPDGRFVAGNCSDNNTVRIWNLESGELIQTIKRSEEGKLTFSADSLTLFMSRRVRTAEGSVTSLVMFNTRTWLQIGELRPPPNTRWDLEKFMSPSGRYLISQMRDGNKRLVEIPTFEEIEEFEKITAPTTIP